MNKLYRIVLFFGEDVFHLDKDFDSRLSAEKYKSEIMTLLSAEGIQKLSINIGVKYAIPQQLNPATDKKI